MVQHFRKESQEHEEMSQEEALATIRRVASPYLIYDTPDDPRNLYTITEEVIEDESHKT